MYSHNSLSLISQCLEYIEACFRYKTSLLTFKTLRMREIKFRAKHKIINSWYYGFLYIRDKDYIITTNGYTEYVVDKKTIGQYIQLKDKNGKEIYEGDIVHAINKRGMEWKCLVVFCEETARYVMDEGDGCCQDFNSFFESIEIIGSIYENHELLNK